MKFSFLHWLLIKLARFIFKDENLEIAIDKVSIGFGSQLFIRGVKIRDNRRGIIINIRELNLSVSIFEILKRKINVRRLELMGIDIEYIGHPTINGKSSDAINLKEQPISNGYHSILTYILYFIKKLPNSVELFDINIKIGDQTTSFQSLTYENMVFIIPASILSKENSYDTFLRVVLDVADNWYRFSVKHKNERVTIDPNLVSTNYKMTLESFSGELLIKRDESGNYGFDFLLQSSGLGLKNCTALTENFKADSFDLSLVGNVSSTIICLNETSFFQCNEIIVYFAIDYDLGIRKIKLQTRMRNTKIAELLRLCVGMKFHDKYIKFFTGSLSVFVTFTAKFDDILTHHLKINVIDKLRFQKTEDFDLGYLASTFVHQVMDDTNRSITLSNENPDYVKLDEISTVLKKVLICTEDPRFYKHNGFDTYYLGQSLALNLSQRRIVRGGSTLTMQLARNLFLGHDRSLLRKLEEVLLTYMIENIFHIAKDRLFEIYLNIIEFGPDIYGIKQAAIFYFSKKPADLNLQEALVISYIVPRPKYFLEAVELKSPLLQNKLRRHIYMFSHSLLKSNFITRSEFDQIDYIILFSSKIGTLFL